MIRYCLKGSARVESNAQRLGVTHPNDSRPHSRWPASSKGLFHRKKGRNRFKPGKKQK